MARTTGAACSGCIDNMVALPKKLPAVEAHRSGSVALVTGEGTDILPNSKIGAASVVYEGREN